jgi:hypothetical protein
MEAQIKFDVLIENFGVKEVSEALEKLELSKDDLSTIQRIWIYTVTSKQKPKKKIKMLLPPIGYFQSDSWGDFGNKLNHPQFEVLKKHIDRAVQDLFLSSLRTQNRDFLFIFDKKIKSRSLPRR